MCVLAVTEASESIMWIVFVCVAQRIRLWRSRTRSWRSLSLRSSKTCRSRSPTSTFAMRTTWVHSRESHVTLCAASRQLIWYLYLFFFPLQVTNPNCPLSFGVSLKNLSLQVTRRSVPLLHHCYTMFRWLRQRRKKHSLHMCSTYLSMFVMYTLA